MLGVEELFLARAELVVGIDLMLVGGVAFEDHEFLVIEDEVGAFVEGGKDGKGFRKFEGVAAGLGVTFGCCFAEFDEAEDFFWKGIADAGDGSGGSAVDEAVVNLGIDSGHQDEGVVHAGDVFGGVAEGVGSTKFLESDEGRELVAEREEEVGLGFETVVGGIINNGGEVSSGLEDFAEVMNLGGGG